MKVHKGSALLAGVAALALIVTACSGSSSGGGNGSSSGANTGASSGGSSSASTQSATQGTEGTGNFKSCGTSPNDCNSGTGGGSGTVTYTIEKLITGWNLNNANSNTFDFAEVLDGVLPQVFTATPDLKPALSTDLMTSATQTKTSPQTIVYKINPKAVWSDGKPINVDDFLYAWHTSNLTFCPKCEPASTGGYDRIKSITGSDGGKTVTMVMKKPYPDWQSLFAPMYPAHIAAQHGGTSGAANLAASFTWFDKNQPTYSGGPYEITGYTKDTSVTLTPNPKWWGDKVGLSKVIFRIITDQTQEVPALQNKEVNVIYPQPNQDIVKSTDQLAGSGVQRYLGKGLTWEHLDFNTKNALLKDVKLRTAIFEAIDRKQIIARTVGQFVDGITPLNNRNYMPSQAGYADTLGSDQGSGNVDAAKKTLSGAGYTGVGSSLKTPSGSAVSLRCSFTSGNVLRQQTCQVIQNQLQQLGIKVTPTPIDSLGETLDKGDFDLIIFAWVGTPYPVQGAIQNWTLNGGGDYGKYQDANVEKLIDQAGDQTDQTKVAGLLNQADTELTKGAYVLPLFQKPTFLAAYNTIVNIRDNATSVGPPYNIQQWGLKG